MAHYPRMTAAHFTFIARLLKANADTILDSGVLQNDLPATLAETWADELEETNPNFDRAKFLTACRL